MSKARKIKIKAKTDKTIENNSLDYRNKEDFDKLFPQETEEFIHQKSTNVSSNLSEIKSCVFNAKNIDACKKSINGKKLKTIETPSKPQKLNQTDDFMTIDPVVKNKVRQMSKFKANPSHNML